MGWTAFLLHRFAHGLDSLFTFEVWVDLSAQMEEPCALWLLLLQKFAIGKLSACEVQWLQTRVEQPVVFWSSLGPLAPWGKCLGIATGTFAGWIAFFSHWKEQWAE